MCRILVLVPSPFLPSQKLESSSSIRVKILFVRQAGKGNSWEALLVRVWVLFPQQSLQIRELRNEWWKVKFIFHSINLKI